ncbi:MAG: glycerophosphodiester phosphodiesterase [Rhodospirillales bacterium]
MVDVGMQQRETTVKPGLAVRRWLALAVVIVLLGAGLWLLPVGLPVSALFGSGGAQVWSHRALADHVHEENSQAAVDAASAQGFPGIELDVHYLADVGRLYVGHDWPDDGAAVRYLDEYALPEAARIWLDVKNLGDLSEAQIADIALQLHAMGLGDRTYVESKSLAALKTAERHGLRTIFWVTPATASRLPFLKYVMMWHGIDAVSCDYRNVAMVAPHFRNRSVFVFTVNEPAAIAAFRKDPDVGVVLTDRHYLFTGD